MTTRFVLTPEDLRALDAALALLDDIEARLLDHTAEQVAR